MGVAKKVVAAVKRATAPKVVVKQKEPTIETNICTNCEDSGRECNVCGGGKDVL